MEQRELGYSFSLVSREHEFQFNYPGSFSTAYPLPLSDEKKKKKRKIDEKLAPSRYRGGIHAE